jgi:hypothetical protein
MTDRTETGLIGPTAYTVARYTPSASPVTLSTR